MTACRTCGGKGEYRVPSFVNGQINYTVEPCYRCRGDVEVLKNVKDVTVTVTPVEDTPKLSELTIDELKALTYTVQYRFQELEKLFGKQYAKDSKTYKYYNGLFSKLEMMLEERSN